MNGRVVQYRGERLIAHDGENVLELLLRHGHDIKHSCKSGHCHACLVRGRPVPKDAQKGLSSQRVEQGYFLSCQAVPEESLQVLDPDDLRFESEVVGHDIIGQSVLRLRLSAPDGFDYRSGQFLHLHSPEGEVRSYSLASHRPHSFLELHVRLIPDGKVSPWLHHQVRCGDRIVFDGPHGTCYYSPSDHDKPLLLAGTGTGMAPLWGILHEALQVPDRKAPIHLVQASSSPERLYLVDELKELEQEHELLTVTLCSAQESPFFPVSTRAIEDLVGEIAQGESRTRAFLCGSPQRVKKMQKCLFLSGISMSEISADPFLPHHPVTGSPT